MLNIYQHRNHQWISMVNQFWAKSIYIPCFCHGLPRFWDRIQPSLVPAVELPAGCPTAWAFATSKRKHESCVKVEESQVPRKDLEQIFEKWWQTMTNTWVSVSQVLESDQPLPCGFAWNGRNFWSRNRGPDHQPGTGHRSPWWRSGHH